MDSMVLLRQKIEKLMPEKERALMLESEEFKFARIQKPLSNLAWYSSFVGELGAVIAQHRNEQDEKVFYRILVYQNDNRCLEDSEYIQAGWIEAHQLQFTE